MKIILCIIVLFMIFISGKGFVVNAEDLANKSGSGEEKILKLQTECPVLGGAIDKSLFVDYKGKRIYVCCSGCIEPVKADPEKFLEILADKNEYAEEVPKETAD